MPVKIAFPHIKVVLLDSLNKRIKFLNAVIEELELENVRTLHGRAEDYAKKEEYREKFDICTSRESGEEIEESKKAIEILGGKIVKTDKFLLANTDIRRALVVIRKERNTPKKYPRKAGVPAKEPLK